jgi:zinc transporter ZupT
MAIAPAAARVSSGAGAAASIPMGAVTMPMHGPVLWIAGLAALVTLSGGLLPLWGRTATGRRLHFLLGATAGLLLTTAFVDLVPEALRGGRAVGWTMAVAFLALYALEWAVGVHGHGVDGEGGVGSEDRHFHRSAPTLPLVAFAALAVHRAVDGLTLPAAFQLGQATGMAAGAAVLVHQFPDGFAAAVLFLAGGWSRPRILAAVATLAVCTPLGTLAGGVLVSVPGWLPYIIGVAGVTFVFVAVAELMPEIHHGPHKGAVTIGLLLGYLAAYVIERLSVGA